MYLCIFEDESFKGFLPLSYNRPVFDFRLGAFRFGERLAKLFPHASAHYLCRAYLKPVLRERGYRLLSLDAVPWHNEDLVVLVNGAVLQPYDVSHQVGKLSPNTLLVNDKKIILAVLNGKLAKEMVYYLQEYDSEQVLARLAKKATLQPSPLTLAGYIWNLIEHNPAFIEQDYMNFFRPVDVAAGGVDEAATRYNPAQIFIGPNVRIDALTVLDARQGPIILEADVIVEPFSYIQGPAVIGAQSRIVGGQIREGTSIGPVCRIGGEVECSIIQGFSNKYHAGFLGHSYLGEWVNIGAMATNSDLKNNYSSIKVALNQLNIDTHMQKLGVFIADHAKIGIGTLLNGGTTIGVGCNVLGGRLPKTIPSFVWGAEAVFSEYRIDKLIETAKSSMRRRSQELSLAEENLLRHIFYMTAQERYSLA